MSTPATAEAQTPLREELVRLGDSFIRLADRMHALNQWPKSHPLARRDECGVVRHGLVKLPPVFTAARGSEAHTKYGDGHTNLVAMLQVLSDYDGAGDMTLADLPARYNAHGGLPRLADKDVRTVHNWLQQVSVALRAAVMDEEEARPTEGGLSVPERVLRRLFSGTRRAFVVASPENRYAFKPLRHAPESTILRWLEEEYAQKKAWAKGGESVYGAVPSQDEWFWYGVRSQEKNIHERSPRDSIRAITDRLYAMAEDAQQYDLKGQSRAADRLDQHLGEICQAISGTPRW